MFAHFFKVFTILSNNHHRQGFWSCIQTHTTKMSILILQYLYDSTHSIFWCTRLYTSSLLFTISLMQSNIAHYSKVRSVLISIECNFCMIWLIPYFWCTQLHTSSLSFIITSIQPKIVGNSKVRAVLFLIECNFRMMQLIPYFWCNQLQTSSISFIVWLIQYTIVGNSKVRADVLLLNQIFSLTFILHF